MFDSNQIAERCEFHENERVDSYIIKRQLGEGTFGVVYEVLDEKTKRIVALKLLKLWEVTQDTKNALIKRFEMEYETGKIKSDNLVHMFGYGQAKGNPYIIMDFCPNGDLRDKIRQREHLAINQIDPLAAQILMGLKALHDNGICHRDLKPENVLLDKNFNARLTDFGIIGHANIQLTRVGFWSGKPEERFGTYAYMPPEQSDPRSRKETILPTIDIFAFGVVMFEFLSQGKLPFGELQNDKDLVSYRQRVTQGAFSDIRKYRPSTPQYWVQILAGCLDKDYKKRFESVAKVLEILTGEKQVDDEQYAAVMGLRVMQGEDYGREYNLNTLLGDADEGLLLLGRYNSDVRNDIALTETLSRYISRGHSTFEKSMDNHFWVIRDGQWSSQQRTWLPSLNGTYLNGEDVDNSGKPVFLNDIITIGNTTLKLVAL